MKVITMIKRQIPVIFGLLVNIFTFSCFAQEGQIRPPAVSEIFYPGEPERLRLMIKNFLDKAEPPSIEGELKGLIVPHAGYEYSGQVAAFAFKLLKNKGFDSVIILGPSHRLYFDGAAVYNIGDFLTPLGIVPVDKELAKKFILANDKIKLDISAHKYEHSIEVELPFLQVVLDKFTPVENSSLTGFSFVPILMSNMSFANCQMLAGVISQAIKGKRVLVIASSDMSHYHDYQTAKTMDNSTLKLIEENRIEELSRALEEGRLELCGAGPVITLMLIMKEAGADRINILNYANSGDVTFDFNRVVGYSAVSFSTPAPIKQEAEKEKINPVRKKGLSNGVNSSFLDDETKKELLHIARKTLEIYLREKKTPEIKTKNPILLEERGAFVTLKKKDQLRGCIGNFLEEPLYLQVPGVAISSAVNDQRFPPVRPEELKDIEIEISVLSPMKRINSLDELVLGKHGIYVRYGDRNGCYLPQVATETGWTKEEFLKHCFMEKARLPADAWEKGAEVSVFTAEVFAESDK